MKMDAHEFAERYRAIYQKLYQYARYTLNTEADAEDAVSNAVLIAYRSIDKLRNPDAFNSWLFQILRATCNAKIKDYITEREYLELPMDSAAAEGTADAYAGLADPADAMAQVLDRYELKVLFMQLPAMDREIIALHIVFGYTTAEIAKAMSMNENTIRSRESRALAKLRGMLLK